MVVSWLSTASVRAESRENKETQIHQIQEAIKELEHALEHNPGSEKAGAWKESLQENKAKLDRLMGESRKTQKHRLIFPEIHLAIEQTEGHMVELRNVVKALHEVGAGAEMLKAMQEKIALQELHLEELEAMLKQRRIEWEKELEEKEAHIRELKAKKKELEAKLERESNEESARELKAAFKEYGQKIERLIANLNKTEKPEWKFAEIQIALERTRGELNGVREAFKVMKAKSAQPGILEALQEKIAQREYQLTELTARFKNRKEEAEKTKDRAKLTIISLKHANALILSEVIEKFLTPSGIIAAEPDSNSLVIKDLPAGLETALKIIKELDVRSRMRHHAERDDDMKEEMGHRDADQEQ